MSEVIVSNEISKAKAADIADLADQLDFAEWDLRVLLFDSRGGECEVDPYTLQPSMESLREAVSRLPMLGLVQRPPEPVRPAKKRRGPGSWMWRGKIRQK